MTRNSLIRWGRLIVVGVLLATTLSACAGRNRANTTGNTNVVTVQRGDTLSKIGQRYGVSYRWIADANNIGAPYTIYPGQRLVVPYSRPQVAKRSTKRKKSRTKKRLPPQTASRTPSGGRTGTSSRRLPQPNAPGLSGRGFLRPVPGKIISRYGPKANGKRNDGVNIAAPRGTSVRAAEHGIVAYAGDELAGFGKMLLIKHAGGWMTAYAHNGVLLVKKGQKVKRGQTVAKVGSTGQVARPQLHFEIRRGNRALNPEHFMGKPVARNFAALSVQAPTRAPPGSTATRQPLAIVAARD